MLFQEAESAYSDRVSLISFNDTQSDQTGLSSSSIRFILEENGPSNDVIFLTRKYSTVAKSLAWTMLGNQTDIEKVLLP